MSTVVEPSSNITLTYSSSIAAANTDSPSSIWRTQGSFVILLDSVLERVDEADKCHSVIASMIRVAGAGFRLSLVLNAVGMEMGTAHLEVQAIARDISLFSLMLKQVGRTMETPGSIASQGAIDTAREIAGQSETVFSEIKEMVEMSQKQDERGNIQSITIAQKVRWCFKKHKMQYLLGQLESLKLSLTIMLQVLQLGKIIAAARFVAQSSLTKSD